MGSMQMGKYQFILISPDLSNLNSNYLSNKNSRKLLLCRKPHVRQDCVYVRWLSHETQGD